MASKMLFSFALAAFLSCSLAQTQICSDIIPCNKDHCRYYPAWAQTNCRKSCGYCSGPPNPPNPPKPSGGSCGVPSIQASRVIGGVTARAGSWPWQVAIYYRNRFHCGGSLVNKNWLVTASHCVDRTNPSGFRIVLGEHDRTRNDGNEQSFSASKVLKHPSYDSRRLNNDVALIKLSSPARLNNRVKTVCLPSQGQTASVDTECYITGWGKASHPGSSQTVLKQAKLKVVSNNVCHALNKPSTGNSITQAMICAGYGPQDRRGGCHGDSGGPFVCRNGNKWTLQGAVSWGSGTCSTRKSYTVFARISQFRQWIDQHIST